MRKGIIAFATAVPVSYTHRGLIAGVLIGYFTEYYTSDTYKPTRKLAGTTKTGSATVIIGGLSIGMLSTVCLLYTSFIHEN